MFLDYFFDLKKSQFNVIFLDPLSEIVFFKMMHMSCVCEISHKKATTLMYHYFKLNYTTCTFAMIYESTQMIFSTHVIEKNRTLNFQQSNLTNYEIWA